MLVYFFKEHEHGMSDHIESQYAEFCNDLCIAMYYHRILNNRPQRFKGSLATFILN